MMLSLPRAFVRAFGQLTDPAILRVLAKSVAITLALFAAAGVALFPLLGWAAAQAGVSIGTEATWLVTAAVLLLAGWLGFRVVALAVLQFYADDIVHAVERRHYPAAAASARGLPWREELHSSLRGALRALLFNALALPVALVLLFTAIGPALVFFVVNGVLLGRELTDMVQARHRPATAPAIAAPARFVLGAAVAGLLAVPIINLLAPVIGAAAATHLFHARKEALPDA